MPPLPSTFAPTLPKVAILEANVKSERLTMIFHVRPDGRSRIRLYNNNNRTEYDDGNRTDFSPHDIEMGML